MTTYESYTLYIIDDDGDRCLGRVADKEKGTDKRWAPALLYEGQCSKKPLAGDTICATCSKRLERYAADPKPGVWMGLVTEPLPDWIHMYGSKKFKDKCRWVAGGVPAKDANEPTTAPAKVAVLHPFFNRSAE
jgi:hypothetical protein